MWGGFVALVLGGWVVWRDFIALMHEFATAQRVFVAIVQLRYGFVA